VAEAGSRVERPEGVVLEGGCAFSVRGDCCDSGMNGLGGTTPSDCNRAAYAGSFESVSTSSVYLLLAAAL
jgi:hypothetical protein